MRKEQDLQVDACLWTKNSAEFLPATLSRFEKVVPQKNIHKKIMIDDHSTDRSAELGERWGWRVYRNESTGISSAANQALRLVTQPFFISLEHDVLLARNWWSRVSYHFQDEKVAIAQGLRLPSVIVPYRQSPKSITMLRSTTICIEPLWSGSWEVSHQPAGSVQTYCYIGKLNERVTSGSWMPQ